RRFRAATDESAHQFVPAGRREEDEEGLRHGLAHLAGALQVDLEQRGAARIDLLLHGSTEGAVAVAAVHDGVLQHLPLRDHPVELRVVDEAVVHTVDLPRARCPGRRRHGEPDLRVGLADACAHRSLADRRGAGQHCQSAHPGKRSSRAARWCTPSPLMRRDAAIPNSSMSAVARRSPTPGSERSRSWTFILRSDSSPSARSSTVVRVISPFLRAALTSARACLAANALLRAASLSCGVSCGSATAVPPRPVRCRPPVQGFCPQSTPNAPRRSAEICTILRVRSPISFPAPLIPREALTASR